MLSLTFHNTQVPHGTRPTQRYLKLNPSIFSTCPNILNQTLSNHILALFKSRTSQSLSFTKPANAPAAGVASYHLNSPSQGPSTAFKASVPDQLMLENCLTCSMLSYVIRTAKQSKGEPQDSSIPCCHVLRRLEIKMAEILPFTLLDHISQRKGSRTSHSKQIRTKHSSMSNVDPSGLPTSKQMSLTQPQ